MALFGSAIFLVLVSWVASVTSDLEIITAKPGDDITLTCGNENINQVFILEWTKPNLKGEETVFLYRSDGIILDQDESYKNRVFLKDPQMKDGDLSVVLENVKIEDSGTYQCRVLKRNDPHGKLNLIYSINLSVSPPPTPPPPPPPPTPPPPPLPRCPGEKGGEKKNGEKEEEKISFKGVLIGMVLSIVVFLAVFLIFLWTYEKIKC